MSKSDSTLTLRQKKFLKSEKPLGFNKSQYQTDIEHKLKKSIAALQEILPNTRNLRKDQIYNMINATTLENIIKNLIVDVTHAEKKETVLGHGLNARSWHFEKQFHYDFRTVELARLLFEVSARYLKRSSLVNENEFLKSDVDKVSALFHSLSKSIS